MSRIMKISFSVPLSNIPQEVTMGTDSNLNQGQTVHYFNAFGNYTVANEQPKELLYMDRVDETTVLLDYYHYSEGTTLDISQENGWSPIRSADAAKEEGLAVTVFRQEVAYDELGDLVERTIYTPVDTYVTNFHFRDYNIKNNRFYRYILYPSNKNKPLMSVEAFVKTKWQGWSITELHPVDSSMKKFTVSSEDVWVFNANVETGDQTQNVTYNMQETLGTYPRFARARQNFVSSNVSCLLGDVLPAEYILQKRKEEQRDEDGNIVRDKEGNIVWKTMTDWVYQGGYTETLPFSKKISSNDKVDMLLAWRKLVYSGNPKLLKDRKGQSFLVAISESSNKPNDYVAYQPDTISFTWTQIGSVDDIQIVDTSFRGGGHKQWSKI